MITQDGLKKLLVYNKGTGDFIWLLSPSPKVKRGDIAGHLDNRGYVRIRIKGKRYQAHSLAFLYVEGFLPDMVDHKNRIRNDNVWENLRKANALLNNQNRNNNNKFIGVCWCSLRKKWRAYSSATPVRKELGRYETHLAACYARWAHDCLGI